MYNELGLAPISHIKEHLTRILKDVNWDTWEMETISEALGIALDELTRDKIHLLQLLNRIPNSLKEDAAFFLHSVDVINNKVADFDYLPTPSSLELAFAVTEYQKLGLMSYLTDPLGCAIDICKYILLEEGYSEPLAPFDFVPRNSLKEGQLPEDTQAKKRAIELYIKDMNNL